MAKFSLDWGVPEMAALWDDLYSKYKLGTLKGEEKKLTKKLIKAVELLSVDPRYPGLHSHEIEALSQRFRMKVWESYLENHTPGAGRLFWVYGPGERVITIIGLEPHPEPGKKAYDRVRLSDVKKPAPKPAAPAPVSGKKKGRR